MALFSKWEAVSYDNLESGMKATGVPDSFVKPTKGATFVLEILKRGDEYCKSESIILKLHDARFKPGKSFDIETWLDQIQTWAIDIDGDKMVEKRKVGDDVVVINYEVKDDALVASYQKAGRLAPCTIKFRKL